MMPATTARNAPIVDNPAPGPRYAKTGEAWSRSEVRTWAISNLSTMIFVISFPFLLYYFEDLTTTGFCDEQVAVLKSLNFSSVLCVETLRR